MTTLTLGGKLYAISPGGRVSAAYQHPHQPGRTLWRRVSSGSKLWREVHRAARGEALQEPVESRRKSRYYADRHCI